jgi:hypothetical protein
MVLTHFLMREVPVSGRAVGRMKVSNLPIILTYASSYNSGLVADTMRYLIICFPAGIRSGRVSIPVFLSTVIHWTPSVSRMVILTSFGDAIFQR